jgi:hypothetical protein
MNWTRLLCGECHVGEVSGGRRLENSVWARDRRQAGSAGNTARASSGNDEGARQWREWRRGSGHIKAVDIRRKMGSVEHLACTQKKCQSSTEIDIPENLACTRVLGGEIFVLY